MHVVLPGSYLVAVLSLATSGAAAYFDMRVRRIPSWLTLPAVAAGPVLHVALALHEHTRGAFGVSGPLLEGMLSVVGASSCAVVPLILWRGGLMGGGDCKLLAACGALLGASLGIRVELVALLLAGYFGLARLALRGQLLSALWRSLTFLFTPVLPKERRQAMPAGMLDSVPLGPFVLAATVVVLLVTPASHDHSSTVAELFRP